MPGRTKEEHSILAALIAAAGRHGWGSLAIEDATGARLTYRGLFIKAFALGAVLKARGTVGVLLPTAPGAAVTFLALHMRACVPAMLNATAGARTIECAMRAAKAEVVLTSRAFIEKAELEEVVQALSQAGAEVIYLEDLRSRITLGVKLLAAAKSVLPRWALRRVSPQETAVILFTSGSEGMPKGVALSHGNILANIAQVAERFHFSRADIMFNALPLFHSFGLGAGTLLPLLLGIRVFMHVSPLQYRVIPGLVKKSGATIMLGTDTFFQGYAHYAKDDDFKSVRLAVAGAEKLKASTHALYLQRFGVSIIEGYGVTEASPVIACNAPGAHKVGTVGRLMDGMEYRLEEVPGLLRGARLLVRGPNIMRGYLRAERPGEVQPQGEWYDTGDIVEFDAEDYITILGRAKRFAKVGGEMVSLALAEECAAELWPECAHATLAVADARKGEQIVLFSEFSGATRESLHERAKAKGVPEIALPRQVLFMETIPRLGSGKVDYIGLKAFWEEQQRPS